MPALGTAIGIPFTRGGGAIRSPADPFALIQHLYTTDDGVDVDDKIGTFTKPNYNVECYSFDGVDDTILVGTLDVALWTTVFIKLQVKWTLASTRMVTTIHHSASDDIGIVLESNGTIRFNLDDGTATSIVTTNSYNDGLWHDVTGYFDGTLIHLTVDAEVVTPVAGDFDFAGASGLTYIGSRTGASLFAEAEICGVQIGRSSSVLETIHPLEGNAQDVSGNSRHGTVIGATVVTSEGIPSWQALYGFYVATQGAAPYLPSLPFKSRSIATFDKVGDTVDFGTHDITAWNTFYSDGWVRWTSASTMMLVSVNHSGSDDIRIQTENTGKLRFALDDGTVKSVLTAVPYNDGEWHFYSAYFTGTTMSLAVDETITYNTSADFDFAGASGAISVGSRGGTALFFGGELDNTRIGGGVDEVNLVVRDPFIVTGKASAVAPNPEGSGNDGTIATGAGGLDSFWSKRVEDAVDGIWVASNYELLTNPSCVLYNLVHNGGSYAITQTDTDYINGTANRWSDGAAFYDLTFAQHQAHVNGLYGSWTKNVTIYGLVLPSEDGQYVIDVAGGAPYDFNWLPETIGEYNRNVAYWTEGGGDSIEPEYDLDGTLQINLDGSIEYVLPA